MDITTLYKINAETNFLDGTMPFDQKRHLCPLSLQQGKEILSLPLFLTDKIPIETILENKINKFNYDNKQWELVDLANKLEIIIVSNKKLCTSMFIKDSIDVDINNFRCSHAYFDNNEDKTFTFYYEDTAENKTKINSLFENHDYLVSLGLLEKMNRDKKCQEVEYIKTRYEEQREMLLRGLITEDKFKDSDVNYEKYLIYKQKLRDLPSTWNVEDIIWPVIDFDL